MKLIKDIQIKHITPAQIFQILTICLNDMRQKIFMVTHSKQLFLFLEIYLEKSLRRGFISNWNEGVISKLHDISNYRFQYNTTEEDLYISTHFIL